MRKTMKSSAIKSIVVKVSNKASFEFEVNGDVFQNVYFEAATRAIERLKHDKSAIIRPVIDCWEKKDSDSPTGHVCCNSYWALVNAGAYDKAEKMREMFKAQSDIDLKGEPLSGRIKSK